MKHNNKYKQQNTLVFKLAIFSALIVSCFCSSVVIAASADDTDRLYRYLGSNNEVVIDDHVPPEFISKGYSVLSKTGIELQKVEPELTAEQKAELRVELAKEEAIQKKRERQEWLLQRYSDAGDAEIARERQLGAIDTLIIVAKSTIKKLKQEEAKELQFAAADERQGKEVSKFVLERIASLRGLIKDAEKSIETNKLEQEKVKRRFEEIIVEMKEIEALRN